MHREAGRPARGDVFARASTRLVALFTAIVVLLVCVSGVVLYLTVKTNIAEVARGGERGESGSETDLASRSISRLRWQLLALDGALIVTVGALGLWYAHRTLRPIRELYGAQKRFVADASHELRTPLAIMKADFEVALRGEGGGQGVAAGPPGETEELRESLRGGLEEVDRMSAIVADLLLLSRIDAHQEELRFAPVDLAELVRDTAEGMRTMAERAGVTLAVAAPDGAVTTVTAAVTDAVTAVAAAAAVTPAAAATTVTAVADTAHIERALRNVVRNAIEHSPPGGSLSVALTATSDEAAVRVTDQGVGIAPADLEHVFDRFYRGDSPRSREGGSGLGLAIARWIVERHGGHITATSTQGQGTTMTLHLPLAGPRDRHAVL